MKIVNKIQYCENDSVCSQITDFLPRGEKFIPDVIAFFVPLLSNETGGHLSKIFSLF